MTGLKEKVKLALDESRILILGASVLVGFQYRSAFEAGFEKLPRLTQYLGVGSLTLMLVALALLLSPAAYHRIVANGEDTQHVLRFTSGVMDWALLPFALGLGVTIYTAGEKVEGQGAGALLGALSVLVALFFWYGLEFSQKRIDEQRGGGDRQRSSKPTGKSGVSAGKGVPRETERMGDQGQEQEPGQTALKDKIEHVLTEIRMILPGAQALLGFQLAIMLVEGFDKLPASHRYLHVVCLVLIAVSTILLMTPAAYHRIVEAGEDTQRFHRFAGRMLLGAMVFLALGVCGDFFVVVRKVSESSTIAFTSTGLMLVLFYGLWFGFTLALRGRNRSR